MRLPGWLHFRVRRPIATTLVGAALIGFVTANLGLPLIVPVTEIASRDASGALKDKSTPFPCQDRPCGCVSADACMRSCCCFSAEERLAWFRAHDVTPIPELIAAAARAGHADKENEKHDDCERCAKAEKKPAPRSCCADRKETNKPAASDVASPAGLAGKEGHGVAAEQVRKGWRVVVVVGSFAAKCHGMGPWSVTGFAAIPPTVAAAYAFDWTTAEAVACDPPALLSAIHSPPTRPPCC